MVVMLWQVVALVLLARLVEQFLDVEDLAPFVKILLLCTLLLGGS